VAGLRVAVQQDNGFAFAGGKIMEFRAVDVGEAAFRRLPKGRARQHRHRQNRSDKRANESANSQADDIRHCDLRQAASAPIEVAAEHMRSLQFSRLPVTRDGGLF